MRARAQYIIENRHNLQQFVDFEIDSSSINGPNQIEHETANKKGSLLNLLIRFWTMIDSSR